MEKANKIINGYTDIVEPILKYPRHRELESSMEILSQICDDSFCKNLYKLYEKINNNRVCIVGPGKINNNLKDCEIIAGPEGGLINLYSLGKKMLFVTTDLDSSQKIIGNLNFLSDIKFVHIHGDNLTRVKITNAYFDNVIYTTQILTPYCAIPIGSFTDGDRAIALSMIFNASEIYVYGFNFKKAICPHKDYCFPDYKNIKIKLAEKILTFVSKKLNYSIKRYNEYFIFQRSF
ncbi:MAG: hypothetical protein ACP5L0_00155 [Caldisphaera sp.]|jgi:uncharacterized Rossmann fold enzyme|uniref:hypothetical protein n=1 Tax=Caldisphaera sp. TaxID=2060322 RepID=UPI003D0DE80C